MDQQTNTNVQQQLWIYDALGPPGPQLGEFIQLRSDEPIHPVGLAGVRATASVEILLEPAAAGRLLGAKFDHLIVHVICTEIEGKKDAFWCKAQIGVEFTREALFESHRRAHSFVIPINSFCSTGSGPLIITESGLADDTEPVMNYSLTISVAACRRERLHSSFAENTVFVFSTARSGSTWLASEILCWDRKGRVVDEPGYGMMFAPIRWDAERFFDLAKLNTYIPSGLEYEIGIKRRAISRSFSGSSQHHSSENERYSVSVFDRYNADLRGPAGLFNTAYREHFCRMIRSALIEHAIDVWGVRHFSRVVFKMPNESQAADFVLQAIPEAKAIHLMRDGRDVMSSRFGRFGSGVLSEVTNAELRRHAISFYSHFWNFQNDIIADACRRHGPERTMFVRYEDLRRDLPRFVSNIYSWLGNPLTDDQIKALVRDVDLANVPSEEVGYGKRRGDGSVGRFKSIFSDDEIELMNTIMGPVLARNGYDGF